MLARVPAARILPVLTAVLVVGAMLAIGGVHPPVLFVLALVSALALATAFWLRWGTGDRQPLPITAPALIFWGLAAWTLVQLIPMPIELLRSIAPANADVWSRALLPFGEKAPGWSPISLDPGATWREVLRWTSYGAAFTAAAVVASRRGIHTGLVTVFAAAVIAAMVTVGHGLAGAREVFGVYSPSFRPQPWHVGPLLNPNNLAGLLNLGALCGLGLLSAVKPPAPRWLLGLGVVAIIAVDITSASRGGIVMLLVGVVALALIAEVQRRRRLRHGPMRAARWLYAGTFTVGVALAILASTPSVWAELLNESLDKLSMIGFVGPAIADYPLLGMGRGTFESVFAAYQPGRGGIVYTHAENFVAQWIVEWGIPVALLALLALGWYFRPRRLGVSESTEAAGAYVGVVVLALQNLLDLGFEIPALCLAVAVTLGTLWGARPEESRTITKRHAPRDRAARWAVTSAAGGLALVGAAIASEAHVDLVTDREAIRASLTAEQPPRTEASRDALRARIRDAIERHPADPYFPLAGAYLAWQKRDDNPLPWLQRSLERSKVNGRAHLLLALVVHAFGNQDQALLELRLAIESERAMKGPAARIASRWTSDVDSLAQMVPDGDLAAETWSALGLLHPDRTVATRCDERALSQDPHLVGPRIRLARRLVERAEKDEHACQGDRRALCADSLRTHAAALAHLAPRKSIDAQLRASWLLANGEPDKASAILRDVCETATDNRDCLRTRVKIAARGNDQSAFAAAAKELRLAACVDSKRCAEVSIWLGDLHARRREWGSAVAHYERAVRNDASEARYFKLAKAARKAGLRTKALRALELLSELRDGDPELERRIKREREKVIRNVLQR